MKNLLKVAIILLATASGIAAGPALAHGRQEAFIAFYDSEDHSNQVGGNVIYCDGHFTHFGSYTLYSEEYYYGCD